MKDSRWHRTGKEQGERTHQPGEESARESWLDEEDDGAVSGRRSREERKEAGRAGGGSFGSGAPGTFSLPGKPGPLLFALLAVILLAGCTLTLMVVQLRGNSRQQEEQQRKEEEMARQLEEIQLYLSSVDETLAGGTLQDEGSYEQLTAKVGTLQKNLVEYRDNNAITDDAIGEDLDGVIAQLDRIQENLEEEKEAAARREENGSSERDQNAKSLQSSMDSQLSSVRADIQRLIQEASGENKAEYQELLRVLNGTDSDLESLEKQIVSGQEKVQSTLNTGLGSINGSVSGLKGTLTGLQDTVNTVKSGQTELATAQSGLLTRMEEQGKEEKKALEDLQSDLSSQKTDLLAGMKETEESLKKQQSESSSKQGEKQEEIQKKVSSLEEKAETLQKTTDSLQEALQKTSESLQETMQNMETAMKENGEAIKSANHKLEELAGAKTEPEHLHMDWDGNETREELSSKEGGCFHTPVRKLDENGDPILDQNGEEILLGYRASCGK